MIRSVDGKGPKIHPSFIVSVSAYFAGDVEIGEGTRVWPDTPAIELAVEFPTLRWMCRLR